MGNTPSLGTITQLAYYTDARDTASCAESVSAADCERVVLGSKWHNWYYADLTYGQATIYFFAAGLAFFTLANAWFITRHRLPPSTAWRILNDPAQIWWSATTGYLSSRQLRFGPRFGYTLTAGETLIVCSMIAFFSVITLAPQPYYWPSTDYGMSPPIATRAGWLAIAILPFQVMFAAKWSPVTVLTGVSHEKLQVYHRWSGWIMYVLALVHTFPFIISDIRAHMMEDMWRTDWTTFSGVLALIPQTVLVVASVGVIRDRFYETFKSIHYLMAAWFLVVLFLHCDFILTSAYYFVGFAATYALSLAMRWGRAFRYGRHRATLSLVDASMLELAIPTRLGWRVGQHFFVRFLMPSPHALTSHPFSAASAPTPGEHNIIKLYIRKRRGMTRALFDAVTDAEVDVLLDGPYGGVGADLAKFDRVLLISGGSGGSVILGTLLDLAARQDGAACRHVDVVYACRDASDARWFFAALESAASTLRCRVEVHLHVTRQVAADVPALVDMASSPDLEALSGSAAEPKASLPSSHESGSCLPGRPNLAKHVRDATEPCGTAGVVVCGPKDMTFAARNAVATEQVRILRGEVACVELYLHTEAFGW